MKVQKRVERQKYWNRRHRGVTKTVTFNHRKAKRRQRRK